MIITTTTTTNIISGVFVHLQLLLRLRLTPPLLLLLRLLQYKKVSSRDVVSRGVDRDTTKCERASKPTSIGTFSTHTRKWHSPFRKVMVVVVVGNHAQLQFSPSFLLLVSHFFALPFSNVLSFFLPFFLSVCGGPSTEQSHHHRAWRQRHVNRGFANESRPPPSTKSWSTWWMQSYASARNTTTEAIIQVLLLLLLLPVLLLIFVNGHIRQRRLPPPQQRRPPSYLVSLNVFTSSENKLVITTALIESASFKQSLFLCRFLLLPNCAAKFTRTCVCIRFAR